MCFCFTTVTNLIEPLLTTCDMPDFILACSELRATLWPILPHSPECLAVPWTFMFSLVAFLVYACVTSPQTEVTALTSTTDIDTLL